MLGLGLRTKTGFPVLFGSLFGGMPLLMSFAFAGRLSLMTLVPLAVFMTGLGLRLGKRKAWRDAFRDTGGGGSGGGSSSRMDDGRRLVEFGFVIQFLIEQQQLRRRIIGRRRRLGQMVAGAGC